ncbi:MAG: hypothetical protein Q4Q23_08215 [Methanobacteriaceae archaeon]|nr:hypothetical protein [Methanobacteriaceae archaeon]
MAENKENQSFTSLKYIESIITKCPKCGEKHFIKYGSFNGIQRYKCKECNHTFSKVTNSLRMYSKKDIVLWNDFIKMTFEQKPLRKCSAELGISLDTAFSWRHKVLYFLGKIKSIRKLKGYVHMEAITIGANNKGNYRKNRPNYINGVSRQFRFLKADKIEIIGVKSSENEMILIPNKIFKARFSKRTFENEEHYKEEVGAKITNKTYIKSYKSNMVRKIAIKHNNRLPDLIKIQNGYTSIDEYQKFGIYYDVKDTLANDEVIEKLSRSISKYLECYRGISTKYLQQYFNLIVPKILMNRVVSQEYVKDVFYSYFNACKKLRDKNLFIRKRSIYNIDIFKSKLIYDD